ncbi:MAG TPA: HK97 family phage prohead protease, partial [Nitrososphaera sp.]|nr:HK97 family phage prohead protease [Nitrososphaera sp.]
FNHDPNRLLGRLSSGTLRLLEDHKGLWFEVLVPEHEQGLLKLAERKDLNGASFGFMVTRDKWGEGPTREIFDVDLVDVSIVTFPAYSSTSVDVRQKNCVNLATYKARLRLLEEETFGGKCLS